MNSCLKKVVGITAVFAFILSAGAAPAAAAEEAKLNLVVTTTMLADLARVIGGERCEVHGLMGPGIDPHLYQASAGDVMRMQQADVVVYNGLHLEGKMGDIFGNLDRMGIKSISVERGLDPALILAPQEGGAEGAPDPHIWFNLNIWKRAAEVVAEGLSEADPGYAGLYQENLAGYLAELDEADAYVRARTEELPEDRRVLVTAHDAFQYFGQAYGFEVKGLQGISTEAEAGTADVSRLATFIVQRQIKAIFIESSVPHRTTEALQAAVKAQGFDVAIGGELYSDSLGGEGSGAESYILTIKANIDTIVDALK